jgi:D-galactosamine 6-phosphate deaminase/isomerase
MGDILESKTGCNTINEIFQQPEMWVKTYGVIRDMQHEIVNFFKMLHTKDNVDIILTGAGSSAFIGNAVSGVLMKYQKELSRVIPTTELITHPDYFLVKNKPTLLVSFARSGSSPESLAAVDIVNSFCEDAYHLIITCSESGELYQIPASRNFLKVLLPPETNDVSLAMTSSFSSMMLAFILISKINMLKDEEKLVQRLSTWGKIILQKYDPAIAEIAKLDFNRAIFLGSGLLIGTAEESHLKLQELTDGEVICAFNSFLGLRHGPRAVINQNTLLVYLFSDDLHSRKYEFDLVQQINTSNHGLAQVSVCHKPVNLKEIDFDLNICFGDENSMAAEIEYLCVVEVLFAQLLGYYKSIGFGLNPDNPSKSGSISRVVEGVDIYPWSS